MIIGETGPRAAPLVETVIERLNMDMGGLPRGESVSTVMKYVGVNHVMVGSFQSCKWYNRRPLKVLALTQRKTKGDLKIVDR